MKIREIIVDFISGGLLSEYRRVYDETEKMRFEESKRARRYWQALYDIREMKPKRNPTTPEKEMAERADKELK